MRFASTEPMSLALPSSSDRSRWPAPRWPGRVTAADGYRLAGRALPGCRLAALVFTLAGLAVCLLLVPGDARHGDAARIAFVHWPAAATSVVIYLLVVGWAVAGQRSEGRLAALMARALAPTGALMAFVALWTGSLWGKPGWGVWWQWTPRLSTEMALFVQYVAIMVMQASIDDPRRGDRAGARLAAAGLFLLPMVYVSVAWWPARHAELAVDLPAAPAFVGLLLMTAACGAWALAATLHRLRSLILECEQGAEWLSQLPEARA